MIQTMLYLMTMIFSFIFLQMNHPLAMGMMLLIQTLMICLMTGLFSKTFWFSYILFLIFLGGMLILFIYVTSLASNEMFSLSMNLTIFSLILMLIIMMTNFLFDKSLLISFLSNNEMITLFEKNSLMTENTFSLNKLYNFPTNFITLLLINYLLISLIAIVKITNIFYGPLRLMN
uniref:NADH-ubiquinone oxidoreductase chain 6 n=1 Tax=Chelipoda sp. YD3012 TaxID=2775393 RepID=A0A7L8EY78_9MUSC|nr:NADH dehydrogenase subunit 6 [Chelipoda sp. YD3012]